jgi:SOS-response transcriptional repressor LexA
VPQTGRSKQTQKPNGAIFNMSEKKLTEKQRATFGFVQSYIKQSGGTPPTFQEIADYFGISVHAADVRLRSLREHGAINWTRHTPRSIYLIVNNLDEPIANG